MQPTIRSYHSEDLDAVYDICVRTGDAGGDARGRYSTDRLLGDVWAGPYVVLEPEHAYVLDDGHGTAVASLAAGNPGVDTEIAGQQFGTISGVAPGAALSVYKACWSAPDPAHDGCDMADVVAAIASYRMPSSKPRSNCRSTSSRSRLNRS